jgi:TPR repeat protein
LAAEQGYPDSQSALGELYWNGRGVPRNPVQAYKWVNLAAARYPPGEVRARAIQQRDGMAGSMSAQQLYEAQRLAHQWQPRTP